MSKRFLTFLLVPIIVLALWWALRDVSWVDLGAVLGQLTAWQIITLLAVNAAILLLFGVRWRIILRSLGYPIPYWLIGTYRLAAFSVSYFTPGPHFGGEPLQVQLLRARHRVPGGLAVASVGLDKILEMAANFSFLVFGVVILLVNGLIPGDAAPLVFAVSLGLLAIPVAYLVSLSRGTLWITALGQRIPARLGSVGWVRRGLQAVSRAETEIGDFYKKCPGDFWRAILVSSVVWVVLVWEYGLALRFLGLSLEAWQVIGILSAARIAILLPMPGGLGALEASQVFMMELLGLPPMLGLGISLLIRARDVVFGLIGLLLGRKLLTGALYASGRKA